MKLFDVIVTLCFAISSSQASISDYFTESDRAQFVNLFRNTPVNDVPTAYYVSSGLHVLQEPVPKEICSFVKSNVKRDSVQSIHQAAIAAKIVGNCDLGIPLEYVKKEVSESTTVSTLYHASSALLALGGKYDGIEKLLEKLYVGELGIVQRCHALHIASQLSKENAAKYMDVVEDLVNLNDEISGKYLQLDGSLSLTSMFITGAYSVSKVSKAFPKITESQALMLASYVVSRKSTSSVKNAYYLLSALHTLSTNDFHCPIVVASAASEHISKQNPHLKVSVTDLMGKHLQGISVFADTATRSSDSAVVLSKKTFTRSPSSFYELDFYSGSPAPERGFYSFEISVTPEKPNKKLLGLVGNVIQSKVTSSVEIEDMDILISQIDLSAKGKSAKVIYPNKAPSMFADHHHRIVITFVLKDSESQKIMEPQQVFVRMSHKKTGQEIYFVAQFESASKKYKFDLVVMKAAKDLFNNLSGVYSVSIIVGDATLDNSLAWLLADLTLTLPPSDETKSVEDAYAIKPEIVHKFREPEKRPPHAISSLFALLVILPLFMLAFLWAKLGVNLNNFTFNVSTITFHIGLAAILLLYYCFWAHLNMFTTLRNLLVIGIITFVSAIYMLADIAQGRKIRQG